MLFRPRGGAETDLIPRFCTADPTGYRRMLVTLGQLPALVTAPGSLRCLAGGA
jgi:hypothetical protein